MGRGSRASVVGVVGLGLLLVVLPSSGCSSTSGIDDGPLGAADAGEAGTGVSPDSGSGTVPPSDAGTSDVSAPDAGPECTKASDCASKVCNLVKGKCEPPTCTDGVVNGEETDLDCGGTCPKCDPSEKCKVAADCTSGVCADKGSGKVCQAPLPDDGVKNGTETDVDCGGTGNPPCADTKACNDGPDCQSLRCIAKACAVPSPTDGVKNGTETDVDCGGPTAPKCADLLECSLDGDCTSDVCKNLNDGNGLRCQVPTTTDGKKNGTETGKDCGGPAAPKCDPGEGCLVNGDCLSQACNYQKKCAVGRSCTPHFGGDTCGLGGAGGVGPAQWEDCCVTATVTPTAGPTKDKAIKLGKYQVTAGRMRAFLTDVSYDVRAFVQQARAAGKIPVIPGNAQGKTLLEPDWDLYLPTSFDGNTNGNEIADCSQSDTTEPKGTVCKPNTLQPGIYTAVRRHLGGFIFKGNDQTSTGCYVGSPGTHAFRFPDDKQDGAPPDFDQDLYDTKSMQCVDYLVGQAFCIWDGGRLELIPEWQATLGPGALPWSAETNRTPVAPGTNTYWGCRFPWRTDANQDDCATQFDPLTQTIEYADYKYSYEYPKLVNDDYIVFISAPGRTRGRGPGGHADVLGNNFELTSTVTWNTSPHDALHRWTGNGSWEVHDYNKNGGGNTGLLNKYGKLGLRCAYP